MSGLDGDVLILLTNVDGFLKKGPDGSLEDPEHETIPLIAKVTPAWASICTWGAKLSLTTYYSLSAAKANVLTLASR